MRTLSSYLILLEDVQEENSNHEAFSFHKSQIASYHYHTMDENIETTNIRSAHPERFWVDYTVEAISRESAHEVAREICLEQTVELPGSITEVKEVESFTVGKIEHLELLHQQKPAIVHGNLRYSYLLHLLCICYILFFPYT